MAQGGLIRIWVGRLAVLALVGVALAATIDAVGGGRGRPPEARASPSSERIAGPDVPQPGALSGTLYLASPQACRLRALDLDTVAEGKPGARSGCGLWAAPRGPFAALTRPWRGAADELWLATLGDPPRLARSVGLTIGDPSWSPDGTQLAWCSADGTSVVLDLARGLREHVAGCRPKETPLGLLTRPDAPIASSLLLDGRKRLGRTQLSRPFDRARAPLDVLGFDASAGGLLAVAVASFDDPYPRLMLELWRGSSLVRAVSLPLVVVPGRGVLGEHVEFSPGGREIAVSLPGRKLELVVLEAGTLRRRLAPTEVRSFAWSPDGVWLARATDDRVVFSGAERSDRVYALPVAAAALAWR